MTLNPYENIFIKKFFLVVKKNKKIDLLFDKAKSNNKSISVEKLQSILGDIDNYDF